MYSTKSLFIVLQTWTLKQNGDPPGSATGRGCRWTNFPQRVWRCRDFAYFRGNWLIYSFEFINHNLYYFLLKQVFWAVSQAININYKCKFNSFEKHCIGFHNDIIIPGKSLTWSNLEASPKFKSWVIMFGYYRVDFESLLVELYIQKSI